MQQSSIRRAPGNALPPIIETKRRYISHHPQRMSLPRPVSPARSSYRQPPCGPHGVRQNPSPSFAAGVLTSAASGPDADDVHLDRTSF